MDNGLEPIVSVCVMTFQHISFIRECLDSILIQKTSFPFEIILGEDESTDGTREICKEYAEKNPNKIKLFLRSRKDVICVNGSPTGRYNFIECLKAAKGKYIALCEGDDYWTDENKLQKQVDFLEANPENILCFTRGIIKNEITDSQYINLNDNFCRKLDIKNFILWNYQLTATAFFRKNKNFDLPKWFSLSPYGDLPLYLILMHSNNSKAFCLPDVTVVYRLHSGGIHGKHRQSTVGLVAAYKKDLQFYELIKRNLFKGLYKKEIKYAISHKVKLITNIYSKENSLLKALKLNIEYLFKGLYLKSFFSNVILLQKRIFKYPLK